MWEAENVPRKKTQMEEHMKSQKNCILSNRALSVNDTVYTQPSNMFRLCKQVVIRITFIKVKVKWSRYRPGVAQRVGRGIALLFHDRGTRKRWVVSSTPRPHFTPGNDPVPILQEDGLAPGPVWTGGKSRPHRDSIPDRPARIQSLYRLSYRPTDNLYKNV